MAVPPRKRSSKRIAGFVLRSGYTVTFNPYDMQGMLNRLKQAIVSESLLRVPANANTAPAIADEILAEITHLADQMPQEISRALVIALLSESTVESLRTALAEREFSVATKMTVQ